ncbi:MAG TPA: YdcF family protein [Gemmataceae bacterium]|nr:YdcF family protein [Gemmataceae bacterium]
MGSRPVQEVPALEPAGGTGPATVPPVRRRRRRLLLLMLIFSFLVLYASRNWILVSVARWLDVSEPPQGTDYVMILGGDMQIRPFAAAALMNAGLAQKALVARIKAYGEALDGTVAPEQELIRSVLVHEGLAPNALVPLDKECASTFDEATALAEFLQARPESSVTIVTSAYHTRRTRLVFRKVLGSRSDHLHFVGVPSDGFTEANWWHFQAGLRLYLDEYLKLAFYLVRY